MSTIVAELHCHLQLSNRASYVAAGASACDCQQLRSLGSCLHTQAATALLITVVAKLAPGRELPAGQPAMQPIENRWTKKRKAEEEAAAAVPPANVVMQFQSDDGVKAGTESQSSMSPCHLGRLPAKSLSFAVSRPTTQCTARCHGEAAKPAAEQPFDQ